MSKIGIELTKRVEFIQAISIDINGVSRGKIFPAHKLPSILEGLEEIGLVELYGTKSEVPYSIEEISKPGFVNKYIKPDTASLCIAPWCDDESLAMIFCDTYDISTNSPWPFNPRLLTKTKLKELEDIGFKLMIGVENKFRLFKKDTKQPITDHFHKADHYIATTTALPFVRKLSNKLKTIGIEIDSWSMGSGKGQVDIPLSAYIGMEGVDKAWMFRELSKYVANDMGLIVSYMTKPIEHDNESALHINHSLLRSIDLVNAMQSPDNDGKLSEIGKNWLSGLMKHSRALSAFMRPTVNCYRQSGIGGLTPTKVSWNYFSRDVAYRAKTNAKFDSRNYIEIRTPSSSCNIYMALSAIVVAGIDGIKNDLNLIAPGNGKQCEVLPVTLSEALEALKKDEVMRVGLGDKFIDWYIKAKYECDVNVLKDVNLSLDTREALQSELDKYFVL